MQFESNNCFPTHDPAAVRSPSLALIAALIRDKITACQAGDITFEKGLDCVATPLVYTRDRTYRDFFTETVANCRSAGCDVILVIGIGGSSLGASAVYEALGHDTTISIPIFFLETINPDQYTDLEGLLRDGGAVQVVIISKSGTTLETAINSSLAIDILRARRPRDWNKFVTVISEEQSPLSALADKLGLRCLVMPSVGGRFSVFTSVGLFPLALAGIDIEKFCAGAVAELDHFVEQGLQSRAAVSALALYTACKNGYWVHDMFVWDPALEQLGKWYRQLCAESLGKRHNVRGELVEMGILPTVSLGTQDLHSMVQLYLGGPRQIVTTFVTAKSAAKVTIPANEWGVSSCAGKELETVRQAIIGAVEKTYREDNRPFMSIKLEKTAHDIGQFMMAKILEIILLGALFEVNVFDQPEVEKYKRAAGHILGEK